MEDMDVLQIVLVVFMAGALGAVIVGTRFDFLCKQHVVIFNMYLASGSSDHSIGY